MQNGTVVNGWTIYQHPSFEDQYELLRAEVSRLKQKYPEKYQEKEPTRVLAAIGQVVKRIALDPAHPNFTQGTTLGKKFMHWRRDKFLQQYRLFFRYSEKNKVIVLCWVNDEDTLRAYGSKTDAYKTFEKMLKKGNPPDDWDELLAESKLKTK